MNSDPKKSAESLHTRRVHQYKVCVKDPELLEQTALFQEEWKFLKYGVKRIWFMDHFS